MYSGIKRCDHSCAGKQMAFITAILFITLSITLVGAQKEPNAESDSRQIADTSKRSAFLPARGRRFWSIFDWDDSSEKKFSRFLPMRGRKAGFMPMRGKKFSSEPIQYNMDGYVYPVAYGTGNIGTGIADDSELEVIEKRAAFMPSRGKKAFHAMRGKKSGPEALAYDDINNEFRDKKSSFYGMRG